MNTLFILVAFLLMAASFAQGQIPLPSDAPKPRSPEESAKAFRVPPGFRVEVIASEPLIASPSGLCWDEQGRLFVSELHGYNLEGQLDIEALNRTGKLDTQVRRVQADESFKQAAMAGTYGVVKLLRDTNHDGRMDRAIVWATNLPPAYGLVPARGGVIVACAPDILFLADHDGDDRPETRQVLFTGFRTGALERGINAPQWGPDGWIYFGRGWSGGTITGPKLSQPITLPASDFRIRADGSAIEPVTGGTHTFGFAMNETGDRFVATTIAPGIFVAPLPWRYLVRNPNLATPSLELVTGDRRAYSVAPPHPWRTKRAEHPEYFKYYRDRYGPAESEPAGWFTSACSPLIYQDPALPGLQGQYFVCEPSGNLIHRALIESDGPTLKLRRAPGDEQSEFAASDDPWSHPMYLAHGPDGAIWIVDYYREIIEDYSAIPRHLQQQYGLYAGHDRGRIYRLTHDRTGTVPGNALRALPTTELVRELASPFSWRRQTAQRLLLDRRDLSAISPLRDLLRRRSTVPASATILALRVLDEFNVLTPEEIRPFLECPERSVRVHALQLSDRWLSESQGKELLETILQIAHQENDPRVQIQLALTLGESRDQRAFAALVNYARKHSSIRWMDTALLSSLHGRSLEMLLELAKEHAGGQALIGPLAKTIGARHYEMELTAALTLATRISPDLQTAILQGLAQGRKNAPKRPLKDRAGINLLAKFGASPDPTVRSAARDLEQTFAAAATDQDTPTLRQLVPEPQEVSETTLKTFVTALSGARDVKRGQQVFLQACSSCHQIGNEGHEVGPDLRGQLGLPDESLLRDLLLPNERVRPGFETTIVELGDREIVGILKEDGATSLTVAQPNGVQHVLLRKDVTGVRRLAPSLMPSFAQTLTPQDAADLLAWLRALRPPK